MSNANLAIVPDLLAITGGPAAGKSEALARAELEFGDRIQVAHELPTKMLQAFPIPGKDISPTPELMAMLQRGIFPSQLALEEWHRAAAIGKGARLVVCDRGVLDGAAYVQGGLDAFSKIVGLDREAIYSRYVAVIHLESLAICNPALYEKVKGSNPSRFETLEQAIERELATRRAWDGYPNLTFVPGGQGIERVINTVLGIIGSYIKKEHERKFCLPIMPAVELGEGIPIEQGYIIPDPGFELRVRSEGGILYLGIKIEEEGESRVSRPDWDKRILPDIFAPAWARTERRRIYKTRHKIRHGDFLLELDVYHGNHEGLVILECETSKPEHLDHLVLPDWAAGAIDVTEDSRYSNRELALSQRVPDL